MRLISVHVWLILDQIWVILNSSGHLRPFINTFGDFSVFLDTFCINLLIYCEFCWFCLKAPICGWILWFRRKSTRRSSRTKLEGFLTVWNSSRVLESTTEYDRVLPSYSELKCFLNVWSFFLLNVVKIPSSESQNQKLNLWRKKRRTTTGKYYTVLQSTSEYFRVLQSNSQYYITLQSIPENYRVLQSDSQYHSKLQSTTSEYCRITQSTT